MKPNLIQTFSFCAIIGGITAAQAGQTPAVQNQTVITAGLSNRAGMPLYTFEKDAPGVSNCVGQCAAVWPPVLVTSPAEVPAGFKTLKRPDGTVQLTNAEGLGLYTFVQDVAGSPTQPATARGHGLREFYLAAPVR